MMDCKMRDNYNPDKECGVIVISQSGTHHFSYQYFNNTQLTVIVSKKKISGLWTIITGLNYSGNCILLYL
jgi:hypothetical protein